MKLIKCNDDLAGHIYHQHRSEPTGRIVLGIHPVLYGFRVIVHPDDGLNIWVNFCGGAIPNAVQDSTLR